MAFLLNLSFLLLALEALATGQPRHQRFVRQSTAATIPSEVVLDDGAATLYLNADAFPVMVSEGVLDEASALQSYNSGDLSSFFDAVMPAMSSITVGSESFSIDNPPTYEASGGSAPAPSGAGTAAKRSLHLQKRDITQVYNNLCKDGDSTKASCKGVEIAALAAVGGLAIDQVVYRVSRNIILNDMKTFVQNTYEDPATVLQNMATDPVAKARVFLDYNVNLYANKDPNTGKLPLPKGAFEYVLNRMAKPIAAAANAAEAQAPQGDGNDQDQSEIESDLGDLEDGSFDFCQRRRKRDGSPLSRRGCSVGEYTKGASWGQLKGSGSETGSGGDGTETPQQGSGDTPSNPYADSIHQAGSGTTSGGNPDGTTPDGTSGEPAGEGDGEPPVIIDPVGRRMAKRSRGHKARLSAP